MADTLALDMASLAAPFTLVDSYGVVTCHVWYKYESFGRVRDSFDDDGVHNLDDQRGKSLCV